MTPLVAGLLLGAALAALANWAAVGRDARALERLTKPIVPILLVAAALAWDVPAGTASAAARPYLLAGLAASLAGDVLLLPPSRLLAGLAAFLVAHAAYLVGFLQLGTDPTWALAGLAIATVVAATVGRILVRAATRSGRGGAVAAYLVAISAMAVAAMGTARPAAIAGAWLFVASDAMLGWGRFGAGSAGAVRGAERGGGRALGLAVMVTYHAAQALIVVGMLADPWVAATP